MTGTKVPMKVRRRFNSTTPAHELTDFQTPDDKVFVVYHMGVPEVQATAWRLAIGGLVQAPTVLSLADLEALPKVDLPAVHECAGSPLRPTVPVRRVGNVVWSGVPLKAVLDSAGIRTEARYVWARGADSGIYPPTGTHSDSYLKDLPLEKALGGQVLLATEMNGSPLTQDHGAPVRLVVPGYYGTCSVKWLTEIRLESTRADGYFTTALYNDRHDVGGVEHVVPVWALAPSSLIVAPAAGQHLALEPQRIWGWAWGAHDISAVDVSTDGGRTWRASEVGERRGLSWQRFELDWSPDSIGEYELVSRATDRSGASQPDNGARNEVFKATVQVGGR